MTILRRPLALATLAVLLAGCSAGTRMRGNQEPGTAGLTGRVRGLEESSPSCVQDTARITPFVGEETNSWWPDEADSLALETDLILEDLVVPLDSLEIPIPDLPDISDSVAAATKARLPSVEELFDYPVVVNGRVLAWVDAYLGSLRGFFEGSLHRSGRYLAMARRIFREEGIPQDLAFLAHVESGFRHNARSPAKALGLWQFMRGTAQLYGLRCDSHVDERLDPERETRAAARYLRDLHALYGDWCLALAAYNAGAGKVNRAINQTGTRDFWQIATTRYLRAETRNFVPAMMAVTILSKSPGAYGLIMETEPPLEYETVRVNSPTDLRIVARCCGAPVDDVRVLNPALLHGQTPPGCSYDVRVPVGTAERFASEIRRIPIEDRLVQVRHTVRRGETLGLIARRYHTTVGSIQDANRMGRRTLIRAGQTLVIPTRDGGPIQASVERKNGTASRHRVRRGESLSRIARRYGVSVRELQDLNRISNPNRLSAGQVLRIPGAGTVADAEGSDAQTALDPLHEEPDSSRAQDAGDDDRNEESGDLGKSDGSESETDVSTGSDAQDAQPAQLPHDCDQADSLGRVASTAHIIAQARLTCAEEAEQAGERKESPEHAPGGLQAAASSDTHAAESPEKRTQPTANERRASSGPHYYVVRRGDTLSGIASRHGVSVADLRAWNRLGKRSAIFPRQQLVVSSPARTTPVPAGESDARVHVVRNGDSLWKIAREYGVGVSDLAQWNGLGRRERIYPGQKLLVY